MVEFVQTVWQPSTLKRPLGRKYDGRRLELES